MDDKVLTVIRGVAGLISGSIASVIAPWINWKIEQRKQKIVHRREFVSKWRAMIFHLASFYKSSEKSGGDNFFDLLKLGSVDITI